ncbi:MAG: hypothetical protein A3H98_06400 [Bacteroidetes bacterium RIFCSPLOWO2_02_FULL_36_8]|nr:MAG: hypothetical protein A3H98_06400 [Bacteroidetes bacterium RIFCSPLOWO2_02_FULL_36_8]OFY69006.1 MAG: hypothetical protein A3G23_13060 [Bacteroidetes bacterium RIFCSPLOWO2_12_FULL_37_12]
MAQPNIPSKSFLFGKINYILLFTGLTLIVLGFIIMGLEKEEFGFGLLGLYIGPILTVIGFIVEIFAIMIKPKDEAGNS